MKAKKIVALIVTVILVFSSLLQIDESVYAATYNNTYFKKVAEYIETYGKSTENGKGCTVKESYEGYEYYYTIQNQAEGLMFQVLINSNNSDRIVGGLSFVLKESTNYISVEDRILAYIDDVLVDGAEVIKSINRNTYTVDTKYTVSDKSIYGYISDDYISTNFHLLLKMVCDFWDGYIYRNLGFGLKSLGFTSYDGYEEKVCTSHTYNNDCDATCNNCGVTRTVNHTYSGDCDYSCNICGYTRTVSTTHSYSNDKDASCNVCGYNRIIVNEDTSTAIYSGTCGNNVKWKVTQNGTLVISGTGDMYGYTSSTQPWGDYSCRNKIKKIQVLQGVTSIGNYAFYYCKNAEEVYIADTVQKLGEKSFSSCESLRKIDLPYGIKTIPEYTFNYCTGLEYIYIPSTVKSFGAGCFQNCSSMKYFIIPDGVQEISTGMFWGCINLEYIQIPNKVTKIGFYAFHECGNLSDIYYTGTQSQYSSIKIWDYNEGLLNATIHYSSKAPCKTCTYGSYIMSDNTYHSRSCTNCGKSEKAKHTWDGGRITKQPTCAEEGEKTYTCTVCKGTKTESIAKNNNHVYDSWVKKDINTHEHECKGCGRKENASHTWDSGKITKQPTCAKEGEKTYTCTVCKGTKIESVAKTTDHKYGYGTKISNTQHIQYCTLCGRETRAAHTWDSGKVIVKPTLDSTGMKTYTCTVCNATKTEEIPKLASGDLNADNLVDNKDVEYLLWHTLFPDKYALEVFADFDFSGDVNNKDVEYLLWHTLFPEKYPLHKK